MNSRLCSTQEECYQLLTYKNDVDLGKGSMSGNSFITLQDRMVPIREKPLMNLSEIS